MALPDFRLISGLTGAHRATREFPKPRGSNPAARLGLRYERNVGKELNLHVGPKRFLKLEHNPWFTYYDAAGSGHCSPDYLLWTDVGVIIIEVKLTWVEVAMLKLQALYCPVVSAALGVYVLPLVVCRNITPKAPRPQFTLHKAITTEEKLLQWPNTGHIQW